MTRVLVSGLSVGNDVGLCQACGFDHEWLLRYPSVILWVDKILLTKSTWKAILQSSGHTKSPFDRSTALVFELLHSSGLVQVIDTKGLLPRDLNKAIVDSVESDVETLVSQFPDVVKLGNNEEVPGQLFIHEDEYCAPYLYSVYSSLLLAKMLNAQCLFNHRVMMYCNYKFGLEPRPIGFQQDRIESFHAVFQSVFPNEPLLPKYAVYQRYYQGEKTCKKCENEKKCSDSYLTDVETQTKKVLLMRDREEIEESRSLINRIIEKNSGTRIDPVEVKEEFLNECKRLSRRNRKVFARTKYWCSLSMILSVPMTVAGLLTQVPSLLATGAGTFAAATGLKHMMDVLQDKYRWTAYFNRELPKRDEAFLSPASRRK
jgi:hypothetical protein